MSASWNVSFMLYRATRPNNNLIVYIINFILRVSSTVFTLLLGVIIDYDRMIN